MSGARIALILSVYLLAYFAASWLETTGTGEFDVRRAWFLTLGGAAVLGACVWLAAAKAERVSEHWLTRPIRSFRKLHLNPFSAKAMEVTPLHLLAIALAFPLLRVAASVNNVLLYYIGVGPIGALIKWVAERTSPLFGFAAVVMACLFALMVFVAPLAARLISAWRSAERRS